MRPPRQGCQGRGTGPDPRRPAEPDSGDPRQSHRPGAPPWSPGPEAGRRLTSSSCPARGVESASDPRTSSRIQGRRTRVPKLAIPAVAPSGAPPARVSRGRRGHTSRRKRKRRTAGRGLRLRPRPCTCPRVRTSASSSRTCVRAPVVSTGCWPSYSYRGICPSSGLAFGLYVKTPGNGGKGPRAGSDGEGRMWGLRLRLRLVRASWLEASSIPRDPEGFSKYLL